MFECEVQAVNTFESLIETTCDADKNSVYRNKLTLQDMIYYRMAIETIQSEFEIA